MRLHVIVTRVVGVAGMVLLATVLALDPRWLDSLPTLAILVLATVGMRLRPVLLTKFSSLTGTGMVALTGAIVAGFPATALGITLGIFLADLLIHGKQWSWAGVNAGREVLALGAAYGWFAAVAVQTPNAGRGPISADLLPALTVYAATYFVLGRGLQYFSLLSRDKLAPDERSLILRYEVISFGGSVIGSVVVAFTLENVGRVGWAAVAIALAFVSLLFRRIIEEAIAAEELNKIHEIDRVVNSDVSIADALDHITTLAHRLVDWREFRLLRLRDGRLQELYSSSGGYQENGPMVDGEPALHGVVLDTGEAVTVRDATRDPRVNRDLSGVRSLLIAPLRFGGRTLGVVVLEHHRRSAYGPKEVEFTRRVAAQIATALQIQDLRRPLID